MKQIAFVLLSLAFTNTACMRVPTNISRGAQDNSSPNRTSMPVITSQITHTLTPSPAVTPESLPHESTEEATHIPLEPGSSSSPQTTNPASIDPPERVEFAPGVTPALRSSLLPSGLGLKQYVLPGNEGQVMTIEITSEDVPVSLTITSPGGIQYFPEAYLVDGGYRVNHSFTLDESGDYLITLTKADHTPSTNYTAAFTIQ